MNILFVCRGNMGRSQIAKAFFSSMTDKHSVETAGTVCNEPEKTVGERVKTASLLECMDEAGFDIRNEKRQKVNQEMLSKYDKIICMAEEWNILEYLPKHPNYEWWDIEDPKGKDLETNRKIRDEIKKKVEQLAKQIEK